MEYALDIHPLPSSKLNAKTSCIHVPENVDLMKRAYQRFEIEAISTLNILYLLLIILRSCSRVIKTYRQQHKSPYLRFYATVFQFKVGILKTFVSKYNLISVCKGNNCLYNHFFTNKIARL